MDFLTNPVVMSLDNVIAIAGAAKGDMVLVAEMIFEDRFIGEMPGAIVHSLHRPVAIGLGLLITLLGWWFARNAPKEKYVGGHDDQP